MKRGRKKLPEELKAKNWTIKVYDWEKEPIKKFIKLRRYKMTEKEQMNETFEISKEMEEKYSKVFDYEPTIEESLAKFSPEFDAELDKMLEEL